jgi:predicted dehydrogenase
MLRVAVIGLGKMGQRHLEKWSMISGAKIVGLVGRDEAKLNDLGSRYNAKTSTSLEDLFQKVEVDVVDVCLPTHLHYEPVKQAAEAGKHVICEKPLGLNVKESREMIDLCEQHNVQLYVGHTLRFAPEYVNAHRQVKNGVIGKPGVIRLSRGTPFPTGKEAWYADSNKSGGIILDLGIHDFDWLIWTFGDVERVMAKHVKNSKDNEFEYALVTLRMQDGTIAHVELSWAKTELEASFELAGDKGLIVNNSQDNSPVKVTLAEDSKETTSSYLSNAILGDSPILRQLSHFKDCIVEGTKPLVTAEEALKAVEVAEASIQSVSTGQPVQLIERGVLR